MGRPVPGVRAAPNQPITPQHHSMMGRSRVPPRMKRVLLDPEQRAFIDSFAIGIFTDCVNAGQTLQAALSALYLSGLQNGMALTAEQQEGQ